MNKIVEKALALWGMNGTKYHLVAARENAVFKIVTKDNTFALRLHRKGYRSNRELWSELQWMDAVAESGLAVPAPIPSLDGSFLQVVNGIQVDVLSWLSGSTMEDKLKVQNPKERAALFYSLGMQMAHMHIISDAWPLPDRFVRCSWNRDGLLGESPVWDRFWENSALLPDDRQLLLDLRVRANSELAQIEGDLDYGLIHADLVAVNIMVDDEKLQFIDFDDGGFGFRLFELATALLKHKGDADYPELRSALTAGYTSVRPIDLAELDFFILLRSTTYVGWNMTRFSEDGAKGRNERFIATARHLAQTYLAKEPNLQK